MRIERKKAKLEAEKVSDQHPILPSTCNPSSSQPKKVDNAPKKDNNAPKSLEELLDEPLPEHAKHSLTVLTMIITLNFFLFTG